MNVVDSFPHKRLIDALVLGKYKQLQVNDYLKEHGFPTINSDNHKIIRSRLSHLFPEHFEDETNTNPDTAALDLSGVRDMYAYIFDNRFFRNDSLPKEAFDKAFKAWGTPQVRRSLQAMAFAHISEEEIELYSNAKYGSGYESEVYLIFFKYFFDPFEWTYMQRREFMENEKDRDQKRLYMLGLTKDPDFIVWKLGLAPTRGFADMLEDVVRDCFYNFKEQKDLSPDNAQKWGNLMLKAMDKIKEVEPSDHGAGFNEEFKTQLKTIDTAETIQTKDDIKVEIPDIREMTGISTGDEPPSLEELQKAISAKK